MQKAGHQRYESINTLSSEYPYSEASILNAATTWRTLQTLLETASAGVAATTTMTSPALPKQQILHSTEPNQPLSGDTKDFIDLEGSQEASLSSLFDPYQQNRLGAGTTNLLSAYRHGRKQSANLISEWMHESNVSDLYGASPPADLPTQISIDTRSKRRILVGLETFQWSMLSGMLWSHKRSSSDETNQSRQLSQGPNATAFAISSDDLRDRDHQQPLLDDETWLMKTRDEKRRLTSKHMEGTICYRKRKIAYIGPKSKK